MATSTVDLFVPFANRAAGVIQTIGGLAVICKCIRDVVKPRSSYEVPFGTYRWDVRMGPYRYLFCQAGPVFLWERESSCYLRGFFHALLTTPEEMAKQFDEMTTVYSIKEDLSLSPFWRQRVFYCSDRLLTRLQRLAEVTARRVAHDGAQSPVISAFQNRVDLSVLAGL